MIDPEAVRKTFCDDAIRTVMLIDDRFPTYADFRVSNVETETPVVPDAVPEWQADRAHALYQAFKDRKLLCDIENNPSKLTDVAGNFDRIRKSDLIILDFNLKGDQDSTDSIALLDALTGSNHFNLVVVYTQEKLGRVWLEIAAKLRGGWSHAKDLLQDDDVAEDLRRDFLEKHPDYRLDETILASFIMGGMDALPKEAHKSLRAELTEFEMPGSKQTRIIEALINEQLIRTFGLAVGGDPKPVDGHFAPDGVSWLQCGTIFTTFMSKGNVELDAASIYERLEEALVAWKPNVLRVLLSQIQNELELKALAYDKRIFESDELQAGWIYHAMTELLDKPDPTSGVRQVVETLYARILDTIGENLMYEHGACEYGIRLFNGYLKDQPSTADFEERMQRAIKLSGSTKKLEHQNVLHALNSYLSTERFRGDHITNGTLFFEETEAGNDQWWVCTSAACDMVPRLAKDVLSWSHALAPFKPMTALRLEFVRNPNLEHATHGRTIFVNYKNKSLCFHAFQSDTHQPRPATFLLGDCSPDEDGRFTASALKADENKTLTVASKTFVVGGQLRPDYASRLLQQVGNHSSRIGVDYVNHPPKEGQRKSKS